MCFQRFVFPTVPSRLLGMKGGPKFRRVLTKLCISKGNDVEHQSIHFMLYQRNVSNIKNHCMGENCSNLYEDLGMVTFLEGAT